MGGSVSEMFVTQEEWKTNDYARTAVGTKFHK